MTGLEVDFPFHSAEKLDRSMLEVLFELGDNGTPKKLEDVVEFRVWLRLRIILAREGDRLAARWKGSLVCR